MNYFRHLQNCFRLLLTQQLLLSFLLHHQLQLAAQFELFVALLGFNYVSAWPNCTVTSLVLSSSQCERATLGLGASQLRDIVGARTWRGLFFGRKPGFVGAEGRLEGGYGRLRRLEMQGKGGKEVRGMGRSEEGRLAGRRRSEWQGTWAGDAALGVLIELVVGLACVNGGHGGERLGVGVQGELRENGLLMLCHIENGYLARAQINAIS